MIIKRLAACIPVCLLMVATARAQQPSNVAIEPPTPLNETAVAFDVDHLRTLEGTLRTMSLSGAVDSPVTNTLIVLKNVSPGFLEFISGRVSFYDSTGVRCGQGLFKVDALAVNESVEVDTPGIRIICTPTSWRILATDLLPRNPESTNPAGLGSSAPVNLVITIDSEEHPIQLGRPLVLNLGGRQRTVMVRAVK